MEVWKSGSEETSKRVREEAGKLGRAEVEIYRDLKKISITTFQLPQ